MKALFSCGMIASLLTAGCAGLNEHKTPVSFAAVRPVLEANCVHCHGVNRLANMPSFSDTHALAKLIGPGNWIVPGHPEASRFYQIVIYADEHPGAMPPTGHAISKSEMAKLSAWIAGGASIPEGSPIKLNPRGRGPRSM